MIQHIYCTVLCLSPECKAYAWCMHTTYDGRPIDIPWYVYTCTDVTSGTSEDWARAIAGVKYTYTVELRDNGTYGFLLPAELIDVSGREMFSALSALSDAVLRRRHAADRQ